MRSGALPSHCLFALSVLIAGLWPSPTKANEDIWKGNKLTSEQPFPAKVRAIQGMWTGCSLLLEEIGGTGRLCFAHVWISDPVQYIPVEDVKKEVAKEGERKKAGWVYLSPAAELDRFSWTMSPHSIGRDLGDRDLLRRSLDIQKERK